MWEFGVDDSFVVNLLFVVTIYLALITVLWFWEYFVTSRCPACQHSGALEGTDETRWVPGSWFAWFGHDDERVQCKYCGNSEWRRVQLDPPDI